MKIKNLTHYINLNSDQIILDELNKSSDEDIIEYVINITSDLLNGVFLSDEYKINAISNFKKYTDDEIGEISTYATLTPYIQSVLSKGIHWEEKATAFLEVFIGYIIGTMEKEEFINSLLEMKNLLEISDRFYSGLIIYFRGNHNYIKNIISQKLL
ncbi:MAG: hypothetical protein RSG52_02735 [Terrisporobacter sp.]|uniref:hypothetical protein n=1 Tax=Terrisporobacter sp. TaxID=1965305 RepID=UPI002FCCA563